MRLPDFYNFEPFNRLKDLMGIEESVLGGDPLSRPEGGEVEINKEDLKFLLDGTLGYKENRIIMYIRDVFDNGEKTTEPKYHVSHCKTLRDMHAEGRADRYVVATRLDGVFHLNVINKGVIKPKVASLNVCQNCLENISFDNFHYKLDVGTRRRIVGNFTPERFFSIYPRSLHARKPLHDASTAPLGAYARDWPEISRTLKQNAYWMCQIQSSSFCIHDYSKIPMRRYLHAHHKNGLKSDNRPQNLLTVCVACHAEEPHHTHLKSDSEYKAFIAERERASSTRRPDRR